MTVIFDMDNINYSIIIPHKNIPHLLQRCLDSIPRRDDIQIIVVDDNSNPLEVDFDNFPGVGEKNVEVYFTKEGKGAGYARNVGLKHAMGKWLIFADADDFFTAKFTFLLDKYVNSEYDIIFFNAESRNSDTLQCANRSLYLNKIITIRDIQKLKYRVYPPWCKIIRSCIPHQYNINFSETVAANDALFSVQTAYYSKKFCIDTIQGYCVTFRNNSLENTILPINTLSRIYISLEVNNFFKTHQIKEKCPFYYIQLCNLLIKGDLSHFKQGLNLCYKYGYSLWNILASLMYDIICHRIFSKLKLR